MLLLKMLFALFTVGIIAQIVCILYIHGIEKDIRHRTYDREITRELNRRYAECINCNVHIDNIQKFVRNIITTHRCGVMSYRKLYMCSGMIRVAADTVMVVSVVFQFAGIRDKSMWICLMLSVILHFLSGEKRLNRCVKEFSDELGKRNIQTKDWYNNSLFSEENLSDGNACKGTVVVNRLRGRAAIEFIRLNRQYNRMLRS